MATFETYGAVGDGVTDDRDAVYNALNSGNAITCKKGTVYYIGSSIEITGKDINISGSPIFLIKDTSNIKFNGTAGVNTTLADNSVIGDKYITVTNSAGFTEGDLISITTSEANSWPYDTGYRNGELHEIDYVLGNLIFIKDSIWTNWTLGVPVLKVVRFIPITVTIDGLIIKYETPQNVSGGLIISYAKNNVLDNVIMHDAQNIGIMFHYCYNNIFSNGSVNGSNLFTGGGYGLRFQGSNISNVSYSSFRRNWKSVESSSSPPTAYDYGNFPNRSLTVHNCRCNGYGMSTDGRTLFDIGSIFVNTHASSQNVIARDNTIKHCYTAFNSVGIDTEFNDNTITGTCQHCIVMVYGKNHKVHGNNANGIIGQVGGVGGTFVLIEDLNAVGGVEVSDNTVSECQKYFIGIGLTLDVNGLSVINNNVTFADNLTYIYSNKSKCIDVVESGNVFTGNQYVETEQ